MINNNLIYHRFMSLLIAQLNLTTLIKTKLHNVLEALFTIPVVKIPVVVVRVAALVKMNLVSFKQLVIIFIP